LLYGEDGELLEPADPHDAIALCERLFDARGAIEAARLSDRQQRILILHLAGFSYGETAALTGDSVRTVERELLRARGRIRAAGG
ncbi:MAG: sigma-70 region 4 domain-containing protein, partial [Solirubrobacterales bacterium]|nr:sigma-70 region 4 domain-containing protein [Solirubrobacterales bacterium]